MNAIKRIRSNILGINQQAFAEAAGVTQPTVSRWERGELSPTMDEIQRICAAHPAVKPVHFFEPPGGSDSPEPAECKQARG